MFATTFPVTVLTLAIPTIADDFGVREAGLSWLITLPVLASALALPVLGKLGDLYGHRKVFIGGFSLALVTTALTATATSPAALIAWRTLTQVAGSSTMPSSLALINSVHHGEDRARAMGMWSMVSAGAPVIGLTVGGPIIDAVGWPTLFLMQAVLMVVPVLASWLVLRETPRHESARFDVAGAVALAVGLGPLLLAVDRAPEWGFTAPSTVGCLAVAVVGLLAFPAIERRVAVPLVPLAFLRSRATTSALLASCASNGAYMGAFFLASLLMVKQFGYSLTSAVPILSIRPALFAVTSPLGGWMTGRAGSRAASVAGCLVLAAGLAGLAAGAAASSLAVVVVVGFLLQGIGFGLLRPAISTALANAVEERDLGMAGAAERLAGQLGVAFCITIVATVYASDVDRFPAAFAVAALIALLAALTSTGLAARTPHPCAAGPTPIAPDPAV
jgi:MFS family permease